MTESRELKRRVCLEVPECFGSGFDPGRSDCQSCRLEFVCAEKCQGVEKRNAIPAKDVNNMNEGVKEEQREIHPDLYLLRDIYHWLEHIAMSINVLKHYLMWCENDQYREILQKEKLWSGIRNLLQGDELSNFLSELYPVLERMQDKIIYYEWDNRQIRGL